MDRLPRYLRRTNGGLLRVDSAAVKREAHLDGKWLLRTSDTTLTPDDLAAACKQQAVAAGRSRTGLAGHEGRARTAPGVPPPRGPDPGPRPTVLARPAPSPEWSRTPPATFGATSATNSTGCTWSAWPPPTVESRSARRPPPGRRRS